MVPAGPLVVVFAPTEIPVTSPVMVEIRRRIPAAKVTVEAVTPSITVAPVKVTTQGTVAINPND